MQRSYYLKDKSNRTDYPQQPSKFAFFNLEPNTKTEKLIDRRDLLLIFDLRICRASSREEFSSHRRRNISRFPQRSQLTSSLSLHIHLLAFHLYPPLLILKIILSTWAPTRRHSCFPSPSHNLSKINTRHSSNMPSPSCPASISTSSLRN